jgi:outer membrane protein assembly factor BamB
LFFIKHDATDTPATIVMLSGSTGAFVWESTPLCDQPNDDSGSHLQVVLDGDGRSVSPDGRYLYAQCVNFADAGVDAPSTLFVLSTATGAIVWRVLLADSGEAGLYFLADGALVVVTGLPNSESPSTLTVFDPAPSFLQRGSVTTAAQVTAMAFTSSGIAFVTTDGMMHGIDASSRGGVVERFTVRAGAQRRIFASGNDIVVAACGKGSASGSDDNATALCGFSVNGKQIWTHPLPERFKFESDYAPFAIGPGFVVAVSDDGSVFLLRERKTHDDTKGASAAKVAVIVGAAAGGLAVAALLAVAVAWQRRRFRDRSDHHNRDRDDSMYSEPLVPFAQTALQSATDGYAAAKWPVTGSRLPSP